MPLDQTEATNQLKAELGQATYPATTTPIMGRLMSANGSATANGTELANSGGSTYAPQNLSTALATAAAAQAANTTAVTWSNLPAGTVNGIETWDSNATPKRKRYGALTTPKTVALGDSLTMAIGALVLTQS